MDLPRPARPLALARLHPVAQPFDLHRALRRPAGSRRSPRTPPAPRGPGRGSCRRCAGRSPARRPGVSIFKRLDQHRSALRGRVRAGTQPPGRADGRARGTRRWCRSPRARCPETDAIRSRTGPPLAPATRSSPFSSITSSSVLASSSARPRSAISRSSHSSIRSASDGIMKVAPSAPAGALRRSAPFPPWRGSVPLPPRRPVAARARSQQRRRRRFRAPCREPDRDAQGLPFAAGFDLDRPQPVEHPARHHLAARPVGAGQHDQQLALARHPDAVEAAQLRCAAPRPCRPVVCSRSSPPCSPAISSRLSTHDQQAAERACRAVRHARSPRPGARRSSAAPGHSNASGGAGGML